ncbi:unnamed protein product [Malus baccata var. baccata]
MERRTTPKTSGFVRPPPSRRPPHPHLCVLLAVSCILVALICILLLICSSRRPLPRLHVTDLLALICLQLSGKLRLFDFFQIGVFIKLGIWNLGFS